MNGNSIGICVGHSRDGDQGASSLGNITEWYYNWSVARHFADAPEVFGLEAKCSTNTRENRITQQLSGSLESLKSVKLI